MGSGWHTVPLGDLAEIFDGPHATPPKTDEGPVFLGISNLRGGRVILSDLDHLSESDYLRWTKRVEPRAGDVVFSYETRLGEAAAIPAGLRCCLGRRMGLLRPRPCAVDHRFLLYAYLGPEFQETLRERTIHGSTVDRIPLKALPDFPITVPQDIREQRAIAHILGTLDDKIELNRRMNETLEAMARALFKSWFVDFDPVRAKMEGRWRPGESLPGLPAHLYELFPERLVDSELGEIPEGWEVAPLSSLATVAKGLSYKGASLVEEGGLPMVNLGCFAGGGSFQAESIKRYVGEYKSHQIVRSGDLVVANTDMTQNRIILGSPALLPVVDGEDTFLFTHHVFALGFYADSSAWRTYVYFALLRPEFRGIAEGYSTGTTVLALPRDALLDYPMILPTINARDYFQNQVGPLLAVVDAYGQESRTLAALRDTLLPKLIAGELRVDPDRILSQAVCEETPQVAQQEAGHRHER